MERKKTQPIDSKPSRRPEAMAPRKPSFRMCGAGFSECFDSLSNGSVEEEPLLPDDPTNSEGTTTVAVIGEDGIHIAADGQAKSLLPHQQGLITSGDVMKILKISDKVVLTVAGNGDVLYPMVQNAIQSINDRSMLGLRNSFKKFRKKWKKKNPGGEFPATVMICGWSRGVKTIITVSSITTTVHEIHACVATGKGWKLAEEHVNSFAKDHFTDKDYYNCLSQAITIASLGNNSTGGKVNACVVHCNGVQYHKTNHVVENLVKHYNSIAEKVDLTMKLICVTVGMRYTYENELTVVEFLRKEFGNPTLHVLAVKQDINVVIRVMTFSDANAAEYTLGRVATENGMRITRAHLTSDNVPLAIATFKPSREQLDQLFRKHGPILLPFDY